MCTGRGAGAQGAPNTHHKPRMTLRHVNDNLAKFLAIEVPPAAERLEVLKAIAAEAGVTFDEARVGAEMLAAAPAPGAPAPSVRPAEATGGVR